MVIGTRGGGGGELPYVVGTYVGDDQSISHVINVGFSPSAVLIFNQNINTYSESNSTLFTKNTPAKFDQHTVAQMNNNGFELGVDGPYMNIPGETYVYIAFK